MPVLPPVALAALACPHCHGPVRQLAASTLGCASGHRFDIARQGYVALLGRSARTDTADSAEMVAARQAFLRAEHFRPIAAAVAELAADAADAADTGRAGGDPRLVVDVGGGTGYYLGTALARAAPAEGIAIDSSKFAARRAAGRPGVLSVVADAWSALPVRTGAAAAVLSIFAPRTPVEVSRILAPAGRLIAVVPEPDHLAQIRLALGMLNVDAGKADRLVTGFADELVPVHRRTLRWSLELGPADLEALVRMGPAARHQSAAQTEEMVRRLPPVQPVTAVVTVLALDRRADPSDALG